MKYGIREICEVVLKAKSNRKIGNKMFYKGEPVIYFDSLKTSTLEGATTTVYATGGRGNARLMAWEGERTVTFTMEDALISPLGLMILTGAGLVEGNKVAPVHTVEVTQDVKVENGQVVIYLEQMPSLSAPIYVMIKDGDDLTTEPYIAKFNSTTMTGPWNLEGNVVKTTYSWEEGYAQDVKGIWQTYGIKAGEQVLVYGSPAGNIGDPALEQLTDSHGAIIQCIDPADNSYRLVDYVDRIVANGGYHTISIKTYEGYTPDLSKFSNNCTVLVDYYVDRETGVSQIEITPDSFGGNFYLEASTLFRATSGEDHPAEFIIPNCKIQSNFSFAMAATGDPSTFTFTMDAFPDYTRFDPTKKVICVMQIIDPQVVENKSEVRTGTKHTFGL